MKLGTENRNEVIALAVLGTLALLVVAYEFWPSSRASAPTVAQTASASPGHPVTRRTKSGKVVAVVEPRLDPTLDEICSSRVKRSAMPATGATFLSPAPWPPSRNP